MAGRSSIPDYKRCEACGAAYQKKRGVSLPQYIRSRACSRSCACRLGHPQREWPSLAERFWSKVDQSLGQGPGGNCWQWTGSRLPFGYGNVRIGSRSLKAHRIAFELSKGPIPAGLIVRHDCDNPSCVNPSHLRLGTLQDNSNDAVARGRTRSLKGEDQPNSKLTVEQVREVRFGSEPQWLLMRKFGVSRSTIAGIRQGRSWRHVTEVRP